MKRVVLALAVILALITTSAVAKKRSETPEPAPAKSRLRAETFAGLKLRGIGPALMSGRIADIAVDPTDRSTWYVAVASGNAWKTVNAGTTWTPIFDDYGSYSIGCVTLDPANPQVVWLGTGENNSQRSVGYGDGVYKSLDGGESWENMGLARSEHIAKILVDPRDSDVVYVAAQGPLWAPGGDRGLYKTRDGGKSWERVLEISANTGISDVAFDPRDPDVLYAASYQRRRRVWTLIAGGPESAIYKSYDGGASWKKLTRGLPEGDVGRIGLAVSPIDPDVVYATIAAAGDDSGFYRSANRGESWVKQSDTICVDPQYYQEIFPDPHHFDRVYAMDVWLHVTDDGGRTFHRPPPEFKHVDHHALVFDPEDPEYLLIGTDGGLYESWDRGTTWKYIANLPVTQFYRVGIDNDFPFYNVYGGTQDNDTQGGPSRTTNIHGIRNSDWFITVGGDGYQTRVDPEDPNILYSMWQYGGLVRYDKRSGELIDIQPQPDRGEEPLKWNWDSPLLISPHSPTRLYFGANRLFRSDDRGDTWEGVSPDLTRGIDRNKLQVMGRVWSIDAVWRNVFTSFYGNMVALDESPRVEGLIYAGMDDGLIQVTEDGGGSWRAIETVPGVPERTYVADLTASLHDDDTVFAVLNNHKSGDFQPYVLRSRDRGRSWTSIAGDLPDRHVVWSIVEDHERADLLFAGTEFGLFFTIDGGSRWIELTGGVPTVAFRDLELQRRENDLVAATFGRGIFILDDYTPLREVTPELLELEGWLFPVKKTWMYIPARPLGRGEKAFQGHALFTAPNPPFGAVFTYYLKEEIRTRKQVRQEAERKIREEGGDVDPPSWDVVRLEDREEPPAIVLTVSDAEGNVVRRLKGPTTAGLHRVAWDLRYPETRPTTLEAGDEFDAIFAGGSEGPMVVPGRYSVSMTKRIDAVVEPLGEARTFETVPLGLASLPAPDKEALLAFQKKAGRLQRAVLAANQVVDEVGGRLRHIKQALHDTPNAGAKLADQARALELRLMDIERELTGDQVVARRSEPTPPAITDRVNRVIGAFWESSSAATTTHQRNYDIAAEAFAEVLEKLRGLVEDDLRQLEEAMEGAEAPWTPGRGVPKWKPE